MAARKSNPLLGLAAAAVAQVNRQNPADRVLHDLLRHERQLGSDDAPWIVRAVFSYFRWRGWLDRRLSLPAQIDQAIQLAERFARDPRAFPDDELIQRAVPDWIGGEIKLAPAWVRSLQQEPALWLRARRGQGRVLAQKLGDCHILGPGASADTVEYRGHKDLFKTPEFHAGAFEVQDLSSQAVGLICAPRPGQTWWDACAGEGGKTLHLSDLMNNQGLIWATDRAAWRLQHLKRRAARARVFNYRTVVWRDETKRPTKTMFDGVLVDAPCSGVGTWQRNPHARWTTSLKDVRELATLQKKLLACAAPAVKPGGVLVYSVCTLTRAETVAVAHDFECHCVEFKPLPIANPFNPKAAPQPQLWFWPQEFSGNGMFVAAWKRQGPSELSKDHA